MTVDIRLLRYFSAVASEGSISRAAEKLHMSQPPLSQQMQQLEELLGVKLLARQKRGVSLTAAGAALAVEARMVMARLEQAVETVQQIGRGELGHIKIGVISSAMWGVFPTLLTRLSAEHPGVKLTLEELSPMAQVTALLEKQIDIGFWRSGGVGHAQFQSRRVAIEAVGLALPSNHPLSRQDSIPLEALRDEDFLMLSPDYSGFPTYLHACCEARGFVPKVKQCAREPQTLLAMVSAKVGVAMLPITLSRVRWPDVTFVKISPPTPSADLFMFYRRDDQSPVVHRFLAMTPTCDPDQRLKTSHG